MKKNKTALPYVLAALALSAGGFALRLFERAGGSAIPLIGLSAAAVVVFLLAAWSLEKKTAFAELFRASVPDAVLSSLGALLLIAGGIATVATVASASRLLGLGAVLAGGAVLFCAAGRYKGKAAAPFAYVLPVLFYVVKLFMDFRRWMVDPAILDYCFLLFALISFMLASFHAAGFTFDKGSRRALALFSLTGVYFGGAAIAGAGLAEALVYGGSMAYLLALVLQAFDPRAEA